MNINMDAIFDCEDVLKDFGYEMKSWEYVDDTISIESTATVKDITDDPNEIAVLEIVLLNIFEDYGFDFARTTFSDTNNIVFKIAERKGGKDEKVNH